MNPILKRISAWVLVLMLVVAALPVSISAAETITTTPTGYTKASDVKYVTGNKGWVYNWGARGETCVFLSSKAQSFYTGSNTFDALSALNGGSSQSNAPQSALYSSLSTLMKSNHKKITNYDETKQMYAYTDCVSNNTSELSSFYSGKMVGSAWVSGGKTWNREHTWPNSKGLGGSDENDIMMLRPTVPSENGSRGNKAYGASSNYFDPGVSNRGDVARIVLYVYVRWGNTNYMWGTGGVMENLDVLLRWMEADPVDTWEMGRNDAVQSITGTRNVFVDYPEFAWLLFGKDVPSGITTPSDNDGITANPGGNSGSNSGGNTGSNSGGNSGSTTTSAYTQISALNNGDKIVIVNPASKKALSTTKTGFYNIGVDVSVGFGSISEAEIFTAKKNSDGTWSFTTADGKKLAMAAEYSSLNETGANDKWTLESAGSNQFYLLNAGRDLYLEWYASKENWSAYKPDSLNSDYVLAFYKKAATGGNSGGNSGGSTGDSTGNNPGGSTGTTTPSTQPSVTPQPSTPATQPSVDVTPTTPSQPAPIPTNPVPAPSTPDNDGEDAPKDYTVTIILVAFAAVAAAAITIVIIIAVKKKKMR